MSSTMRPAVAVLALAVCCTVLALLPTATARPQQSPFQGGRGPVVQLPRPGPDNQRHGDVLVTGGRTPGVGTSLGVSGQGDVWVSRNGQSRVTAGGHYDRVIHGPARGAQDYGAHVQFKHNF